MKIAKSFLDKIYVDESVRIVQKVQCMSLENCSFREKMKFLRRGYYKSHSARKNCTCPANAADLGIKSGQAPHICAMPEIVIDLPAWGLSPLMSRCFRSR